MLQTKHIEITLVGPPSSSPAMNTDTGWEGG